MDGRQTTPRRAVVLAPHPAGQGLWQGLSPGPGCAAVTSAYEAAAELLASPAAALVVDLRLLRPGHVGLIQIARKAGAELWGVGPLPAWASSEQLNGMRLLGRGQLVEALRKLGAVAAAPPAGGQPSGQRGTYEPSGPARQAPAAGGEPLLTAEELDALLGDVK
jgi:hypothetical protein